MSSSRFPGKVLAPFRGRPLVRHVLSVAEQVCLIDDVILVTSTDESDAPLSFYVQAAGCMAVPSLDDAIRLGARFCIIATDTGRHALDGIEAAEWGLHLLVEKPLATDATEARRLCARAAASRKIFVGCVMRFSKSLNTFREMLNSIGRVNPVRIECQSYLPDWRPARDYRESYSARPDEGGVLRDLIYEIDYAGWLFGWPCALQAKVKNLGRLGINADEAVG